MTRRQESGRGRVTGPAYGEDRELPSLRKRQPVVFWGAIIGLVAMVLTTFGSALSAFL